MLCIFQQFLVVMFRTVKLKQVKKCMWMVNGLQLYRAFLVLQSTQSALQHESAFTHSHTYSYSGGKGDHARCSSGPTIHRRTPMARQWEQFGLGVLLKDTATHRLQGPVETAWRPTSTSWRLPCREDCFLVPLWHWSSVSSLSSSNTLVQRKISQQVLFRLPLIQIWVLKLPRRLIIRILVTTATTKSFPLDEQLVRDKVCQKNDGWISIKFAVDIKGPSMLERY